MSLPLVSLHSVAFACEYLTLAQFFAETVGMKVDCLMGTYGRYSLACEALACFPKQTEISQATLLTYNQHPVTLHFAIQE